MVMAVHNQAMEIEQNLPRFLTQQCDVAYEVIVVDDSSSDETPDVLKRLKTGYPLLYTTFLPKSVVYNPSRLQLALTVGAKAAHYTRIVLADINRPPLSDDWLAGLSQQTTDDESLVFIYSKKRESEGTTYRSRSDLEDATSLILKAERRSGRGHRGRWLKGMRGVYDAVSVPAAHVHDAIRLFDKKPGFWRLWGLRLQTYFGK